MIDIATATPDELREAMSLIATRLAQIEQEAATTEQGLRAQLGAVVTDLDKLIGPDNPTTKIRRDAHSGEPVHRPRVWPPRQASPTTLNSHGC